MIWNRHTAFKGLHSGTLSPSKYHWINYDDDKFDRVFVMQEAARLGVEIHDLAKDMIRLKVKVKDDGTTLSMYVNHAIGYRMRPEMTLMYSINAFGTTDAISFRKKLLRIHDLKTGKALTSFKQLEIYDALFCLEYGENPFNIKHELRIYQNDDFKIHVPDPDDIMHIMQRIKYLDKRIDQLREEDEL